ncbi:hypothetical protein, partial [Parvibaculum sp.]|uniref:hypothetical protein n=1 Tax=Parvibaculum sp. TaxID=2024848 RepID=UPI0025EE42D2
SDAARAGATTIIALTIKLDPSVGADQNHLASYTFVKKEESEPCQAADLIAWHVRKGYEYLRAGKRVRPDTMALIKDKKTLTIEFDSKRLKKLRDDFCRKSGDLKEASKLIFSNPEG